MDIRRVNFAVTSYLIVKSTYYDNFDSKFWQLRNNAYICSIHKGSSGFYSRDFLFLFFKKSKILCLRK